MLRRGLLIFTALAGLATQATAQTPGTLMYIGTQGGGPGQGIFAARLDPATGALTDLGLALETERPTWLETDPHRPILYGVNETGNDGRSQGGVFSLAIDPASGKLRPLSQTSSGGGGATNLTYDAKADTVFVANFGGGQVSAIPVKSDGALSRVSSVQTDYGTGPTKRQAGPHAHGVTLDPSGRFVLAPDLGADRVFVYRFDPGSKQLTPAEPPFAALPPGSGPRHLVFSRDGRFAFLDTELSAMVYTFRWDAKAGRLDQVASLPIDGPDFSGQKSAAELGVSADGRFLYVSDRGANTLIVYGVDARTGGLHEVQRMACGGDVPWSFSIDPSGRWLLVANQASGGIAEFQVDVASGRLTPTANSISVPKPVRVAFFRP